MSTDWARMKDDEDFANGLEPKVYGEEQRRMYGSSIESNVSSGSNIPPMRISSGISEGNLVLLAYGGIAAIASAGYGIYKLIEYIGDKF